MFNIPMGHRFELQICISDSKLVALQFLPLIAGAGLLHDLV